MIDIEECRLYCLSKPFSTESFPFGDDTLVFKVFGKMFGLIGLNSDEPKINLKCDPEWAAQLREQFPEDILPGYHMNKKHWNTVRLEGGLSKKWICRLIDHSYHLVLLNIPQKVRQKNGI